LGSNSHALPGINQQAPYKQKSVDVSEIELWPLASGHPEKKQKKREKWRVEYTIRKESFMTLKGATNFVEGIIEQHSTASTLIWHQMLLPDDASYELSDYLSRMLKMCTSPLNDDRQTFPVSLPARHCIWKNEVFVEFHITANPLAYRARPQ
jgi:hypothetical protein